MQTKWTPATMGQKGGKISKRYLSSNEAKGMVAMREIKRSGIMVLSRCCYAPVKTYKDKDKACKTCKTKDTHYFSCSKCDQQCCVEKSEQGMKK